jgi:hypothetical protein
MTDTRIIYRPIQLWPGQLRSNRSTARFGITWTDTVDMLDREAYHLGAREVVVHLAVSERDIRRDDRLRADVRPKHPGVLLVLPDSRHGRLSWHCDMYRASSWSKWRSSEEGGALHRRMPGWQANLRAIVETMNGLRTADRHGVTSGRQYAGFQELPSGIAMPEKQMTVEDAARVIAKWGGGGWADVLDNPDQYARSYRRAAREVHPDRGGRNDEFQRLQDAKALLDAYHRGAA